MSNSNNSNYFEIKNKIYDQNIRILRLLIKEQIRPNHLLPPKLRLPNKDKVNKIIEEINKFTSINNKVLSFILRSYFTKGISWWLPSYDVLEKICEITNGKTILELGAGLGLMSIFLSLLGSKIIAVDDSISNNTDKSLLFFKVENITIQESLEKYQTEVLLIVWPLFHGFSSNEIFEKFKGNIIILIGERNGGCTTDIYFPNNWKEIDHDIKVKNWDGIHDELFIYQKLE